MQFVTRHQMKLTSVNQLEKQLWIFGIFKNTDWHQRVQNGCFQVKRKSDIQTSPCYVLFIRPLGNKSKNGWNKVNVWRPMSVLYNFMSDFTSTCKSCSEDFISKTKTKLSMLGSNLSPTSRNVLHEKRLAQNGHHSNRTGHLV